MAKVVHLCTSCGHQAQHHSPFNAGHKPCTCCRREQREIEVGPSTVVDTWSFPGSQLEPLFEPGTVRNAESGAHREQLCGCDECRAVYAAQVGA